MNVCSKSYPAVVNQIPVDCCGEPGLIVLVDTADMAVTEFIVTISVSSITEARWRIEVAH